MKLPLASSLGLALITLASMSGCKRADGNGDDTAFAESSIDSSDVGLAEAELLASALDGAPTGTGVAAATPDQVAAYIATHLSGQYTPAACITATTSGLTVTVSFDHCTGPRGLIEVDGDVVFTVHPSLGGGVTVDATSTGLIIGDAMLDLNATAVYTTSDWTSSLAVTTRTTGTGGRGYELDHVGEYTVTWDASCASIDGAWSTTVGERARSTVASLQRCRNECPTGTLTRDTLDGREFVFSFDGTAIATWTSSGGRSGRIPLLCP